MKEKHGMTVTLSLVCGTCGRTGHEAYIQWCCACNAGICPTCFPKGQDGLWRCKACIEAGKPTKIGEAMERLGQEMAEKREKAFWESFLSDSTCKSSAPAVE